MNVTKYEVKRDYYLGHGTIPQRLETKKYKLLGILGDRCDYVSELNSQPDHPIAVKTINSDPESQDGKVTI